MTRELICGPCFDALDFQRIESLPGAHEFLSQAALPASRMCVVCGLPFKSLPDGTPNVDLVHSESLLRRLAVKYRHLSHLVEAYHASPV